MTHKTAYQYGGSRQAAASRSYERQNKDLKRLVSHLERKIKTLESENHKLRAYMESNEESSIIASLQARKNSGIEAYAGLSNQEVLALEVIEFSRDKKVEKIHRRRLVSMS